MMGSSALRGPWALTCLRIAWRQRTSKREGMVLGVHREPAQPSWLGQLAGRSPPATAAAGDAGGHVDALDGARRRLVVLELVVDLEPVALGVSYNQPTVVR